MANLPYMEKSSVEKFLGMKTGYVLDFTDATFREFIGDAIGLDIDDPRYRFASNSKANRLRQFIKTESNFTVGTLLEAFCNYWLSKVQIGEVNYDQTDEALYKECIKISNRLKEDSVVQHIDAIQPNVDDRNFKLLSQSIQESIKKNEPEAALDRLHTFTFRYIRELCERHKISYDKKDSLNAIFGKYVKFIVDNKHVESVMSEKILKYSIGVIEAFNDIRNNKSFAHDNVVLNYQESILIFNNVSNTIKFIESIEKKIESAKEEGEMIWSELPF